METKGTIIARWLAKFYPGQARRRASGEAGLEYARKRTDAVSALYRSKVKASPATASVPDTDTPRVELCLRLPFKDNEGKEFTDDYLADIVVRLHRQVGGLTFRSPEVGGWSAGSKFFFDCHLTLVIATPRTFIGMVGKHIEAVCADLHQHSLSLSLLGHMHFVGPDSPLLLPLPSIPTSIHALPVTEEPSSPATPTLFPSGRPAGRRRSSRPPPRPTPRQRRDR